MDKITGLYERERQLQSRIATAKWQIRESTKELKAIRTLVKNQEREFKIITAKKEVLVPPNGLTALFG